MKKNVRYSKYILTHFDWRTVQEVRILHIILSMELMVLITNNIVHGTSNTYYTKFIVCGIGNTNYTSL